MKMDRPIVELGQNLQEFLVHHGKKGVNREFYVLLLLREI